MLARLKQYQYTARAGKSAGEYQWSRLHINLAARQDFFVVKDGNK